MNDAARFGRLLRIASVPLTKPGTSAAELALMCGVSTRTIFRDLNRLRELGFDLTGEGGYRRQEDIFGPDDRNALSQLDLVLLQLGELLREAYGPIADQVFRCVQGRLAEAVFEVAQIALSQVLAQRADGG